LGVLQTLNYEEVMIATKVRVADIVGVRKGIERSQRQSALNRVSSKHIDFLLIRESDGKPMLAVELDDSSHEQADRAARDAFVDELFHSVGLPILHIVAKVAYDPKIIDASVQEALSQKG